MRVKKYHGPEPLGVLDGGLVHNQISGGGEFADEACVVHTASRNSSAIFRKEDQDTIKVCLKIYSYPSTNLAKAASTNPASHVEENKYCSRYRKPFIRSDRFIVVLNCMGYILSLLIISLIIISRNCINNSLLIFNSNFPNG